MRARMTEPFTHAFVSITCPFLKNNKKKKAEMSLDSKAESF